MKFRFSLRYRVALTFLLLGWLVSMAMGGMLYLLMIDLEEQLIEETLSAELNDFMRRYAKNPESHPPTSRYLHGYAITEEIQDSYPVELHNLAPGLSHVTIVNAGFYVEKQEQDNVQFLMLYADELIKHRESQYLGFLAVGIVVVTLLASFSGLWLADRVIAPVTRLARQVTEMEPEFDALPVTNNLPRDEVGELAQAIDDYRRRLAAFIERERAFTSNVSHELRTPLAVIEGATEVLLTKLDADSSNQSRVKRIERATTQMTRLTAALLALAREESGNDQEHECLVDNVLDQVVKEHHYLLDHKQVTVKLDANSDLIVPGDPVLLYIVLANIIRNAFSYTNQGTVHVHLKDDRVIIEDTGRGMREDQLLKMFDRHYSDNFNNEGHGIGLSLVRRICERYGWEISVTSDEGRGTLIELQLIADK